MVLFFYFFQIHIYFLFYKELKLKILDIFYKNKKHDLIKY